MTNVPQTSMDTPTSISSKRKLFYGWWIVIAGGIMLAVTTVVYAKGIWLILSHIDGVYPFVGLSEETHEEFIGLGNLNLVLGFVPITIWVGMLIPPFAGTMVDRFGSRRIVLFGVILAGSGYMLVSATQATWDFHAAMVPLAVGMNLCTTAVFAATVGKWFVKYRVRAFAILMAIGSLSSVGTVSLGLAIEVFDWRVTMIGIAALVLLVGIPVALVMRGRPEDQGVEPDGASREAAATSEGNKRRVLRTREISPSIRQILYMQPFWQLIVALGLVGFAGSIIRTGLDDAYNQNYLLSAIMTLASWLLVPAGMLAIGFVGDRSDKRVLLTKLVVLKAVGVVIIALGLTQLLPSPIAFVPVLVAQVITNFATGALLPLGFGLLADYFGRERLGAVLGINSSMNEVVYLIATLASVVFLLGFGSLRNPLNPGIILVMLSLVFAFYLCKTLEPQSRVAARIRLSNRARP